jgi:RsbT co-antagonist protein rsbRD N-terminal domain
VRKQVQNRQHSQPSGSTTAKSKRMPDVIAENKDWVVDQWLQRVNANAELTRVSLSDAERRDHVPDLLDEAVANACGHRIRVEERQRAAERHGTLRYHQGYSVPMLILEAQLLQDVIAECIRDNFLAIDLSNLIPDMAKTSDTITAELRESASAYMKQYEWHAFRPDGRTG